MSEFITFERAALPLEESLKRAASFRSTMETRRSIRSFSDTPVPKTLIEDLLMTASSAPSGAHKQPWTFCAISDPKLKTQIREAAEKEEFENYHGRMSDEWLKDLQTFGTDWHKPFIEVAPWIIVVFKRLFDIDAAGNKHKNYYVNESVGIATGMLLTAVHQAGLVALTHTPSPMNFLQKILNRPDNERPFLLIPIGYPHEKATVPRIARKPLEEVVAFY